MIPPLTFDLVPVYGRLDFTEEGWNRARWILLELQPSTQVSLIGDPPSAIRVAAWTAEVAPGVLAMVSELAGVDLVVANPQGP